MAGSETGFIAIGAIGFLVLLVTLILGEIAGSGPEIGIEHELEIAHELEIIHEAQLSHDVGSQADLATPSWLSVRVMAASLVGFGAVGFIAASSGLPPFLSWPLAAAGFVAVGAGTYLLILKPLAGQQYNSLMSRYNYVGRDAVVTVDILPGGIGQVTFRDRQGARITQTAWADLSAGVNKGSSVKIVDLAPGGVVVHHNSLSD